MRECNLCVTQFLSYIEGTETVEGDHPQVKLNNLDNLKSTDSTICPFSVIALTPISVNGLVHFNPRWLIKVLSSHCNGSGVRQRQKKP